MAKADRFVGLFVGITVEQFGGVSQLSNGYAHPAVAI
jgi:hypothetical protein